MKKRDAVRSTAHWHQVDNERANGYLFEWNGRFFKTHVDDKGRVCTGCLVYMEWEGNFNKDRRSVTGYAEKCKRCLKDIRDIEPKDTGPKRFGNMRNGDRFRYECIYDPTNTFLGSFSEADFTGSLDDDTWPVGSIWLNRDTGQEIEIKTIAVTLKKGQAKRRIKAQRDAAKHMKPVAGLRQVYT